MAVRGSESHDFGNIIHDACHNHDVQRLQEIMNSKKYDPNQKDEYGRTALHIAATRGTVDMMKLLISRGADVHAKDRGGNTPLHHCGHSSAIYCLKANGADVLCRNNHNDTPLTLACRKGIHQDVLKVLIKLEEKERTATKISKETSSESQPKKQHDINTKSDDHFDRKVIILLIVFLFVLSLIVTHFLINMSHLWSSSPSVVRGRHFSVSPGQQSGYKIEL